MAKSAVQRTERLSMGAAPVARADRDTGLVWLVKVSAMYVTEDGWLAGDPAKGEPFRTLDRARRRRDELRGRWFGRLHIVRRRHLKASQW